MRPKDYSIQEVFNNTSIGLTFEFYSSKKTAFIAEDLAKPLGKTVVVTGDEKAMPTWSSAILLKEYNGKRPRYQLKIAHQEYMAIGPGLHGVLAWINEHAALDYSTKMSVDLSFKHRNLQTLSTISNMDVGKMILKLDETFLYDRFPQMKESPFALSIKRLVPFDGFINISNALSNLNTSFQLPIAEYYAVDFTNQTMGNLKFNYIGGSDYASKPGEINETLRYYIISTYQVLNSIGYTADMQHELKKLTEEYSKMRRAYYEPDYFLKEYSEIRVSVDLKRSEQITKSYWSKLRNPLLKLVLESDLKRGDFNLDTDEGRFELRDAELNGVRINGFHLVRCQIKGLVENCNIWESKIMNSRVKKSILISGNDVTSSLLEQSRADRSNTIEKSYIINQGEIINCQVNESIIKNAGIGQNAHLDEECTLVQDRNPQAPPPNQGLQIGEIRDYRWLKDMREKEPDPGYGNEFKINYE
jgi:hypothetical protein